MVGQDPEKEIDGLLVRLCFSILMAVTKIAFTIVFVIVRITMRYIAPLPGFMVMHLVRTGYGLRYFHTGQFLLTSGLLLWLSIEMQSLAGDWVFLMWAVYTAKWLVEYFWMQSRHRKSETHEHTYHAGVLFTQAIGVESEVFASLLVFLAGIVLLFIPTGYAVGAILATGGFTMLIINQIADTRLQKQELDQRDQMINAAANARIKDQPRINRKFHRVRIR